jgi:uncharacterized protein YgbK (DUF1537 family)
LETTLICDTTKEESMRKKYQGSTKVSVHYYMHFIEFEVLAMKEGETVDEYFAITLAIASRLIAHCEKMEQVLVVNKILRSMTSKFNYVVCSIA